MANRNELRVSRYKYLTSLGYTAKQARRLRDLSTQNIVANITDRVTEARIVPFERRSQSQRKLLTGIEVSRSDSVVLTDRSELQRISRTSDRRELFSLYSKRRGFPVKYLKIIHQINKSVGLSLNNSYGYRVFYHEFVEGLNRSDARAITERRDT